MHKQSNQQFYISSHRNQNFPNNHKPPAPPKTFTLAYPRCNHFTAPSLLSPPIHTQPPTQPHARTHRIYAYSDIRLSIETFAWLRLFFFPPSCTKRDIRRGIRRGMARKLLHNKPDQRYPRYSFLTAR